MIKRDKRMKSYKYTIYDLFQQLSREQYLIAWNFFPHHLRVSKDTFKAWVYIKEHEAREIPGRALLLIAQYFDVKATDLFVENLPTCNHDEMIEASKMKNLKPN